MNVLLTAEDFAYGPAAKGLTVAAELIHRGHRVTFAGTGTALELARRGRGIECVDMPTSAVPAALPSLLDRNDVAIVAGDFAAAAVCQKHSRPYVWLDSLFWWWPSIPNSALDADLYVIQQTLPHRSNWKRYRSRLRNVLVVGPILPPVTTRTTESTRQLLVNLSGGQATGWYRVGAESDYPRLVMDVLVRVPAICSTFDRVVVTGGQSAIERAAQFALPPSDTAWTFESASHETFQNQVARSAVVLTVPGLESVLEAAQHRAPLVFLPPSNPSQVAQLAFYGECGLTGCTNYDDIYEGYRPRGDLRQDMDEFLQCLSHICGRPEAWQSIADRLQAALGSPTTWATLADQSSHLLRGLPDAGTSEVVTAIECMVDAA